MRWMSYDHQLPGNRQPLESVMPSTYFQLEENPSTLTTCHGYRRKDRALKIVTTSFVAHRSMTNILTRFRIIAQSEISLNPVTRTLQKIKTR